MNASHIFEFVGVLFQLAVLAIVLSYVGFKVRAIITRLAESRQQSKLNEQALVEGARRRAAARSAGRASLR